jgi:hypothetical protein
MTKQDENGSTSYRHLSIPSHPSLLTQTSSIMLLESPSLIIKQKPTIVSFVEKIKNDQTTPLLNSSKTSPTIKPYVLTDTTPNS